MHYDSNQEAGGTPIAMLVRRTSQGVSLKLHFLLAGGGYLGVATVELFVHWLLTQRFCRLLLWGYSLHTASGGVYLFSDLLLPALLLGWWNGWVTRESSSRRALAFVVPLSIGTVALLPLYAALIGRVEEVWWWPTGTTAEAVFLTVQLFFVVIAVVLPIKAFHKSFPI